MAGRLGPDAFDYDFALGAGRSYPAVGEKFRVTKKAVTRRAVRECWLAPVGGEDADGLAHHDDEGLHADDEADGEAQ